MMNLDEDNQNDQTPDHEKPAINQKPIADTEERSHAKGVVEALLFVSEKPVRLDQLKAVLPTLSSQEIKQCLRDLSEEYESKKSGVVILEIADGYQMLSNRIYASYVQEFYKTKHKEKLSKPALESLAIIAYKQPVTRADIESVRGVNSDGVVAHLMNKELIKVVGRRDVPGKPFLYGTTKQFLEYFGLKSLTDLPKLEEFSILNDALEQADYNAEVLDVDQIDDSPESTDENKSDVEKSEQTPEDQMHQFEHESVAATAEKFLKEEQESHEEKNGA